MMLAPVLGLGMIGASVLLTRRSESLHGLGSILVNEAQMFTDLIRDLKTVYENLEASVKGTNCAERHQRMLTAYGSVTQIDDSIDFVEQYASPGFVKVSRMLVENCEEAVNVAGALWNRSCMKKKGSVPSDDRDVFSALMQSRRKGLDDLLNRFQPPPPSGRRGQRGSRSHLKLIRGGKDEPTGPFKK